jgi:hypothetical protein
MLLIEILYIYKNRVLEKQGDCAGRREGQIGTGKRGKR